MVSTSLHYSIAILLMTTNLSLSEECDCHQLRIENRLLRDLVLSQRIPVPEIQSGVRDDIDHDDDHNADIATNQLVISDRTSELVTSITTIVTSPVITEVPIWWQNR